MIISPPMPPSMAVPGAVIILSAAVNLLTAATLIFNDDTPRAVLHMQPTALGTSLVVVEGLGSPLGLRPSDTVRLVYLDEADALRNLRAVGLGPEIIDRSE